MADRWTDERDREWRDRERRRSEAYGRGGEGRARPGETRRWGEERTWAGAADDDRGPYDDAERDRAGYGEGSEDYGAAAARPGDRRYGSGYADEAGRADYGSQGRRGRWSGQGYGGRVWRRDWDEGRVAASEESPDARRSWEDEGQRSYGRGRERLYGAGDYEGERRYFEPRRFERRDPRRSEGAGDFLQRAGERISSWFRGGEGPMPGGREEPPRWYREDWGREARPIPEPGRRGLGPKGYRRSDERINEEVHERLTEDPWLDASGIEVQVKDGEVTLAGHVENREAKHRAERLVEDVLGVAHVQNNLRVNPEGGLTSPGRGYGSSAAEAGMRSETAEPRPAGAGTETSVDPKTGSPQ